VRLCWHGKGDVRVDTVPDPTIEHPRDAIIRITACAICGSDLHLLDGYQPTMEGAVASPNDFLAVIPSLNLRHIVCRRRPHRPLAA
jgi:threonine dehydrogenase-like Zn-dependent dehydrogenase